MVRLESPQALLLVDLTPVREAVPRGREREGIQNELGPDLRSRQLVLWARPEETRITSCAKNQQHFRIVNIPGVSGWRRVKVGNEA